MRNLLKFDYIMKKFKEALEAALEDLKKKNRDMHVSISQGNRKMGAIPSVSLMPWFTCPARAMTTCGGDCYAARDCNLFPPLRKALATNTALMREAPHRYWKEVRNAMKMTRYFRFHVSGDIPSYEYFVNMVDACIENDHCEVLCFTKNYEVVNKYIDRFGPLPKNLHLLFSGWKGLKPINPHNLPETNVIFPGMELPEGWLKCGGNCSNCGCMGVGCWQAKAGDTIAFDEH